MTSAEQYILYGSEMSPYSVKVRSYLRHKSIPHQWIARQPSNDSAYKSVAKLPIIPTLVLPTGEGMQDSTPIIEWLEAKHPTPSIHPADPVLGFLSTLVEEFGDEWGNKIMFHYRWWDALDQQAAAQTLARLANPEGANAEVKSLAEMIRARMTGRGYFVGSSAQTAPLIERYFLELIDLLSAHLRQRRYLFGNRPAFGDFGLAAQLYEAAIDPTCGSILRGRAPIVLDWCLAMNHPVTSGEFETWESLAPSLTPLLGYIGRTFLVWSNANAKALNDGLSEFSVDIDGMAYTQQPQKYHAKSLAALKAKYALLADNAALNRILGQTNCLPHLL
jgi:glutathione S-transferase